MFWFGTSWGIRADLLPVASKMDDQAGCESTCSTFDFFKFQVSLYLGVSAVCSILEAIWNFQNRYVHLISLESPIVSIKTLELKVIKHWRALPGLASAAVLEKSFWSPPPPGCIKLNVDAALLPSSTRIVVIARDEDEMLIKAWAKTVVSCEPLLAEAIAIHWAILLAKSQNWSKIMIESDSKVCVDALVSNQQYDD